MSTMNTIVKAAILAALAPAIMGSPAMAQGQGEPRSETVSFGDLDLTKSEGVAALDQRLSRAIKRVCRVNAVSPLRSVQSARQCRKDTAAEVRTMRNVAINTAIEQAPSLAQGKPGESNLVSFRNPE